MSCPRKKEVKMICKIKRCSNLDGILGYNYKKEDKEIAEVIDAQHMPHYKQAGFNECRRILELWGSRNDICQDRYVHINVNPAPQDWRDGEMTVDLLRQVTREYLEMMGYGGQPYVMLLHKDKAPDRWHAHVVTTCIKLDGSRISDKFEQVRSVQAARSIEQKYYLKDASKKTSVTELQPAPVDYRDGEICRRIGAVISYAQTFTFADIQSYNAILSLFNVRCRLVDNGEGKKGMIYYCIDKSGRRIGRDIPSNKIHHGGTRWMAYAVPDTLATVSILDDKLRSNRSWRRFYEDCALDGIYTVMSVDSDGRRYLVYVDARRKVASKLELTCFTYEKMSNHEYMREAFVTRGGGEGDSVMQVINDFGRSLFLAAFFHGVNTDTYVKRRKKRAD